MQIDEAYLNREHSGIKHWFLSRYLEEASYKVLLAPGMDPVFNYIDGFAGPWDVSDELNYTDSSFDLSVRVLKRTQDALAKMGRSVRIRFFLCEKDPVTFKKLEGYAARQSGIELKVFEGAFEDHLSRIAQACKTGFTFTFIDPKGWSLHTEEIARFLAAQKGDFILNFMANPINRHAGYDPVEASFGRFLADPDWKSKMGEMAADQPNHEKVMRLLKARLKALQAAKYLPDFTILNSRKERVQMRLVLGTNHPQGVEVFRSVQRKVEQLQLSTRTAIAAGSDPQPTFFPSAYLDEIELKRTGVGCPAHVRQAARRIAEVLEEVGRPLSFELLAAKVMEDVPVRQTNMKDILVDLRKGGMVAFDLPGTRRKPDTGDLISLKQG
ncbi:MAG: hypothetical protein CVT82_00250 [Alphaproteobacteria bacterium HGW-Alphaproteobacteria-4]|nr:MAG: hypothetical protein CVT82_00250 [Alphaproteobacteria bacterium HGW-Alphaproteobacteria-4]